MTEENSAEKIVINKMEEAADFIDGYWVIKPEHTNKEIVFACPIEVPIKIPDDTSIVL